jgi:carboxymethylenebutenolidase
MCDQHDFDNMQKQQELSRRQFGALGFGAGVVAMLPAVANAADVKESEVTIKTPDGNCDAHFVHPVRGATAAVLVWPDIFGLRDSFRQMESGGRVRLCGADREPVLSSAEGPHWWASFRIRPRAKP